MHPVILNVSAYRFVTLDDTAALRPLLKSRADAAGLRGTILLAPEGINLFIAGQEAAVRGFLDALTADPRFAGLETKLSWSEEQPFNRMLVKLKREIITMKMPLIQPEKGRAPAVDARTLKRWLDQGHDDAGKPVVMMDTRNAFEVDVGTFDKTVDYRIEKFSEFPEVAASHKDEFAGKTVVTFCTGGIRCEKAAIFMAEEGLDHVYQLEGGILKYFEETGGPGFEGRCFVFDGRETLGADLA